MGDLPYISSERWGGLIIRIELIYEYHVLYLYNNFELKRGWAYNTSCAYNTYYTVLFYSSYSDNEQVESAAGCSRCFIF